ncbi:hypothetical protein [Afifella sp. IM 167]|uniref:hypothetical protein n=1 Tax=Afifella sp. IM 167 TaxID=2033586 RepID=UPI001CCDD785|nr:hypothetical protein [Afifella sp. IM 167]MBZ8132275.1 hypothetical protein [Afifella sp. IM 167]
MTESQLSWIGGAVGLAFAIADYVLFGVIVDRARQRGERSSGMGALDFARKLQLVLFPIVGWFVGPLLYSSFGGQ